MYSAPPPTLADLRGSVTTSGGVLDFSAWVASASAGLRERRARIASEVSRPYIGQKMTERLVTEILSEVVRRWAEYLEDPSVCTQCFGPCRIVDGDFWSCERCQLAEALLDG